MTKTKIHPLIFHSSHLLITFTSVLLLLSLLTGITKQGGALPSAGSGKEWSLVFSDEFSGSSVDTNKWNVINNTNFGANNNEDHCIYANNISVGSGALKITAKRETVTCSGAGSNNPDGPGDKVYHFTSGLITTRGWYSQGANKFKFSKGYAEARIKMPSGNPFWGAFWLVSPDSGQGLPWPDYGEIDITELVGGQPDLTHSSMWYKCSTGNCSLGGTNNLNRHNISNDSSNFGTQLNNSNYGSYTGATNSWHTYGAKIDDNKITYYFDNVPILDWDGTTLRKYIAGSAPNCTTNLNKCESTSPPTNGIETLLSLDRAIILNLAVGGKFPTYDEPDGSGLGYGYTGNEDGVGGYNNGNLGATLPGDMEIDYVRVYKLQDAPEQPTETSNEGSGISSGSSSGSSSTNSSSGNSSASNSSSSNKESDDTDSLDGETEEKSESVAASQNGSGSSDDIAGNVATDLNKLSVNKPNPIIIIFSSVAAISAITLSGLIIFKPSFRIAAHKIFSHFVLHH